MGATNERGPKALEFAERHKLVIANTLLKHTRSRSVSWYTLNGQCYQIYFIMVTNKLKSCIQMKKTRTFPAPDARSDHDLVMPTIIVPLFLHKSFTVPASPFHYSIISVPLFHHLTIAVTIPRCLFYCSIVSPSLFHCSTIIVPLFHHHCSVPLFYCSP